MSASVPCGMARASPSGSGSGSGSGSKSRADKRQCFRARRWEPIFGVPRCAVLSDRRYCRLSHLSWAELFHKGHGGARCSREVWARAATAS
eukprot:7148997-Pyramimonas_sp.AAC.1